MYDSVSPVALGSKGDRLILRVHAERIYNARALNVLRREILVRTIRAGV
jgi:hypothetical protein